MEPGFGGANMTTSGESNSSTMTNTTFPPQNASGGSAMAAIGVRSRGGTRHP